MTQYNEFADNYTIHDTLQEYLIDRLSMVGLDIEQFGTDGDRSYKENPTKGYGPDLKVYNGDELVAYVEIKSKRLEQNGDDWYGRLDKEHYSQYLYGHEHGFDGAKGEDVLVVIFFGVVSEEGIIVRNGFIPVEDEDQVVEGFRMNGDIVVTLDKDDERNLMWLLHQIGI